MSQAILTKYIGPTNHRGARVRAWCQAGSIMMPWDDGLDVDGNHDRAAHRLASQFRWLDSKGTRLVGGGLPDGTGNAYIVTGRLPSLVPDDSEDSELFGDTISSEPPTSGEVDTNAETQRAPKACLRLQ